MNEKKRLLSASDNQKTAKKAKVDNVIDMDVDDATDVCPDFDRKETLDLAKAVKNQQQAATAVEQAVQAKEDAFQRYVSVQQLWKAKYAAVGAATDSDARLLAERELKEAKANVSAALDALDDAVAQIVGAKATLEKQTALRWETARMLAILPPQEGRRRLVAARDRFHSALDAASGASDEELAAAQQVAEQAAIQSGQPTFGALNADGGDAKLLTARQAAYDHARYVADLRERCKEESVKKAMNLMNDAHQAYREALVETKQKLRLDDDNTLAVLELLYSTHHATCMRMRRPQDRGVVYRHDSRLLLPGLFLDREEMIDAARAFVFDQRMDDGQPNIAYLFGSLGSGKTRALDEIACRLHTWHDSLLLVASFTGWMRTACDTEPVLHACVARIVGVYFVGLPRTIREFQQDFLKNLLALNESPDCMQESVVNAILLIEKHHHQRTDDSTKRTVLLVDGTLARVWHEVMKEIALPLHRRVFMSNTGSENASLKGLICSGPNASLILPLMPTVSLPQRTLDSLCTRTDLHPRTVAIAFADDSILWPVLRLTVGIPESVAAIANAVVQTVNEKLMSGSENVAVDYSMLKPGYCYSRPPSIKVYFQALFGVAHEFESDEEFCVPGMGYVIKRDNGYQVVIPLYALKNGFSHEEKHYPRPLLKTLIHTPIEKSFVTVVAAHCTDQLTMAELYQRHQPLVEVSLVDGGGGLNRVAFWRHADKLCHKSDISFYANAPSVENLRFETDLLWQADWRLPTHLRLEWRHIRGRVLVPSDNYCPFDLAMIVRRIDNQKPHLVLIECKSHAADVSNWHTLPDPRSMDWNLLHNKLNTFQLLFSALFRNEQHPLVQLGLQSFADVTIVFATMASKSVDYAEQRQRLIVKANEMGLEQLLLYDKVRLARHFGPSFQVIPWLLIG